MQKIKPWLWFDGEAEEAANFYVSVFERSKIIDVSRYGEDEPGTPGQVMVVAFELDGVQFMALNGGSSGDYAPAFYVECASQEEVDRLWDRLGEGGQTNVCGWLKDRYGVSWNVVPELFGELMSKSNDEQRSRVMQAMLQMTKMDCAALQRAYDGT